MTRTIPITNGQGTQLNSNIRLNPQRCLDCRFYINKRLHQEEDGYIVEDSDYCLLRNVSIDPFCNCDHGVIKDSVTPPEETTINSPRG